MRNCWEYVPSGCVHVSVHMQFFHDLASAPFALHHYFMHHSVRCVGWLLLFDFLFSDYSIITSNEYSSYISFADINEDSLVSNESVFLKMLLNLWKGVHWTALEPYGCLWLSILRRQCGKQSEDRTNKPPNRVRQPLLRPRRGGDCADATASHSFPACGTVVWSACLVGQIRSETVKRCALAAWLPESAGEHL